MNATKDVAFTGWLTLAVGATVIHSTRAARGRMNAIPVSRNVALSAIIRARLRRQGRRAANPPPLVESWPADVVMPIAIRIIEIIVQGLFVGLLNDGTGNSFIGRFTIWDSRLYAEVTTYGYPSSITGSAGILRTGNNFAFSPLYPALTWFVNSITRIGILNTQLVISVAASVALSVIVYLAAMGVTAGNRKAAYVACSLIGVLPMAIVLQMGYAEALYAALSAGAILATQRRQWLLAGALCFLAGATRPTGYIAVAPLPFIAWIQRRRSGDSMQGPSWAKVLAASAFGLSSTVFYWVFVAIRTHKLTGWFDVQQLGWGTHFDGGRSTVAFVWHTLQDPSSMPGLATCVVLILLGAIVAVVAIADPDNSPYVAIGVVTIASVAMSTNYWHSKPRLLLAGALLVIPVAQTMANSKLRNIVPIIVFGLAISSWLGAYMVTRWPYAI